MALGLSRKVSKLPFCEGVELEGAASVPQPGVGVGHATHAAGRGVGCCGAHGALDLGNHLGGVFGCAHPAGLDHAAPAGRATGDALVAAGKANQTTISGGPVQGPLFDFAPAINQFLQAHLFGDIFERDNLDWQSRELATVGALAAMPGVEAQLLSHMRASLRVGLSAAQLRQLVQVLAAGGDAAAAQRAGEALTQALAAASGG